MILHIYTEGHDGTACLWVVRKLVGFRRVMAFAQHHTFEIMNERRETM